jgi:hypothetical protein
VGGVGVNVVRHGADLPLLHDLRIAHANKVSNDLVSLFKLFAELKDEFQDVAEKRDRAFFSLPKEILSHAARPRVRRGCRLQDQKKNKKKK